MALIPKNDLLLSRYELATYGIGYLDVLDVLYVGSWFTKHRDIGKVYVVQPSPSHALALIQEAEGTPFIGVKFMCVSRFVAHYWNGEMPRSCPIRFVADLADLCFGDPDSAIFGMDAQTKELAWDMHARARQLADEVPCIPNVIVERIRDNNPYKKLCLH